jgi:hypothetical protein
MSILFNRCASVSFTSPQPHNGVVVKSFREDVQGVYSDEKIQLELMQNILNVDGIPFRLVSEIEDENELLVKYYKDFYFASFKDSLNFIVFKAKIYDDKLALYMVNGDAYTVELLNEMFEEKMSTEENNQFVLDLSRKEFDQLIENGMFDLIGVLTRAKD